MEPYGGIIMFNLIIIIFLGSRSPTNANYSIFNKLCSGFEQNFNEK